ncbi:SDR family oxidoreductase [soil metagenome]
MIKNKTALVTGAANGIGKAITHRLVKDGFHVIAVDIDETAGLLLENELGKTEITFLNCNICDGNAVKILFDKISKSFKTLDLLVNNAGIIKDNMIWKMPEEDFDDVISVNLKAPWLLCKEASILMKSQNNGRIVNITSRAWLGNRGQSNYSASKAGIVGLTRVLALELGKYNVLVNAVAPGLIDTPLSKKLPADVLQKLIEAQPTKQMGKPEDVANAVSFLANEQTQFITGQIIYVDGGKSIGAG